MTKYGLIILLSMALLSDVCSVSAQIADTKFGENIDSVKKKITNRFGYPDGIERTSMFYLDRSYAGHDWSYITFDFNFDEECESHLKYIGLSQDFKYIASASKYLQDIKGSLHYKFERQKDEGNVIQSYKAKSDNTLVELYIYKSTGVKPFSVTLSYAEDSVNYIAENLYLPIANASFGETVEMTKRRISNVFGSPDFSTRDFIGFDDKNYADIDWNLVSFHFQYDSQTSHLDGIMFVKQFETSEKAKSFRDRLVFKTLKANEFMYAIDANGFKRYRYIDNSGNKLCVWVDKTDDNKYDVTMTYRSKIYSEEETDKL